LKLAMDWYGSGNQDPDEFERLILSIVAQRTWVGLTDEELSQIEGTHIGRSFARAIEAKLKEKNT